MAAIEYLELQGVLHNDAVITDVEHRENRVFFKVDGHQFQTMGYMVHHKNHPLANSAFGDIFARKWNTPEGIQEEEELSEQVNKEIELWFKHRSAVIQLVMLRAFVLLRDKGEEAFLGYIDHHLDIMENDNNCKRLIEKLEKT